MKQQITTKQIEELSEDGKLRLWEKYGKGVLALNWENGCQWNKAIGKYLVETRYLPYLSIGQMIEFLDKHYKSNWSVGDYHEGGYAFIQGEAEIIEDMNVAWVKPELCDALWESVKEVLEQENETEN